MRKGLFILLGYLFITLNSFSQDNEIWYTSSDGNIVTPYNADAFGAVLLSNTYENGKGIMTFDAAVVQIGDDEFSNCTGLTSITIPESVTSIGDYAFFGCAELNSITIPEGVTSIGSFSFSRCSGLTSITVDPNNAVYDSRNNCNAIIESTSNMLIAGCVNTIIPEGVTSIGEGAFSDCCGTSITIPNGVTNIGDYAFDGCALLTSISIPNSVTNIGFAAFGGCIALTSITIPEGVSSIGDNAFNGCSGLTSITIPASVSNIGNSAFYHCSGLISITIPEGVTSIGDKAFCYCSGLTTINVDPNNAVYDSRNNCNAIIESASNILIVGCVNTIIPEGVTSIGDHAFEQCSNLVSVLIPEGITNIGYCAFYLCTGLTAVEIPNSVTSICESAFAYCYGVQSIEIPNSVTSIGAGSFYHTGWYDNQPDGMVYLGDWAYTYKGTMPADTHIQLSNGTIGVADCAFNGCEGLVSIDIPSSVTYIGYNAFYGCTNIEEIIWNTPEVSPNIVTSYLRQNSFNVVLGNEITEVANSAFSGCTGLTSISIPNSVISIGDNAFYKCIGLTSIDIPNSVTSIGNNAFYSCTGLTSINIPNSVTSIGESAFFLCSELNSITISGSVESIGNCTFMFCSRLPSITIPNSVTSIGLGSFYGCTSLSSVSIGNSVTSIGEGAFSRCIGLTSIEIPNSVTSIGAESFFGCTGLTFVSIGNNVSLIEPHAFSNCTNLSTVKIYAFSLDQYGVNVFNENAAGRKIYVFSDCLETYRSNWSEYAEDILPITQTANDAGGGLGNWCSYYNGYTDVSVPDGTTIYKAALNGESVTLTEIPGNVIKKGEAVVLKSTSSSVTFSTGTWAGSASAYEGNELQGVDASAPQADGIIYYVLSKVGDVFGFYKLRDDVDLGAGKAYLAVAALSPVQPRNFLSLGGPDEGTTSVPTIISNEDVWYNLYGVKLQGTPSESGLYIHNGKTVMIK